jgi:hypothetical protein
VQVVLMIRQMEYSSTQASAARVSLLTIGQQVSRLALKRLCLLAHARTHTLQVRPSRASSVRAVARS